MSKRFPHDCSCCHFLGQHEEYDLYYCEVSPAPTVIARFGSEPHEYGSGMLFADLGVEPFLTAKKKAEEQGFLNPGLWKRIKNLWRKE